MYGTWSAIALGYILWLYGPKGKPLELKKAGLPFSLNSMVNLSVVPLAVLLILGLVFRP